ncbi:MAG TPA: MFS transporter, partial [Actinotalea sp.]|nr:MFS transporter [Actinotalea sp.]
VRALLAASVEHGPRRPPVRWLMLSGALLSGVGIYAFYAMQPYLLELYGDQGAYAVAGLAAAVLAATRIAGGLLAPRVRRGLGRRTTVLLGSCGASAILLALLGVVDAFVPAVLLLVAWGVSDAAAEPVRRALLNDLIESPERATVLSVDSLVASAGGVVLQPTLGRVADGWGYGASYLVAGAVQMLALPLLVLTRRTSADADTPDTPGR